MVRELNRLLPLTGIGATSCALMKTIEVGSLWGAALNALFLVYCVAVTMSRMK